MNQRREEWLEFSNNNHWLRDIMDSISFILFIINITALQLLSGLPPITAADISCDNGYGNFTSGSSYGDNRDKILSSLYTDTTAIQGFYSGSSGNASDDTVYVISYCRGDSTTKQCINCLNATAVSLMQACPNQKKAVSWGVTDPPCTIRYSDTSIYGILETDPEILLYNTGNITMNQTEFDEVWLNLTRGLAMEAAKGSLQLKYATGERVLPNFETIFALMQCSPDISESFCQSCLLGSINDYQGCCRGHRGGPIMKPSCIFRWDLYPFYATSTPPSQPPTAPPPTPTNTTQGNGNTGGNDSSRTTIIIVVVVVVAAVSVGLIMCLILLMKKRKKMNPKQENEIEGEVIDEISNEEWLHFDLETVKAATNNFSETNKLGRGGFGTVYKGKLSNGREIAVKRLSISSGQGQLEFKNEVTLLVKLQHRNLVRLLGFCLEGIERLLIYEYVANSSLDHFIFDPLKRTLVNWETRFKIITGIARGILYLHEDSRLRIIHRDLKASNILLDEDMNPKIADFGMAKLFSEDQTRSDTSRVVGTYGYMAPEYIMQGNFSVKTDVFSFGVLVLEIVSGRSNSNFNNQDNGNSENIESLISYTWKNWREQTLSNIIDPTLRSGSTSEMARCIHIGLLCVEQHIANRPTMAAVVMMLNSHSLTLQVPVQPAFILGTYMESDSSTSSQRRSRVSAKGELRTSNTPDQLSNNDVTISEVYPR